VDILVLSCSRWRAFSIICVRASPTTFPPNFFSSRRRNHSAYCISIHCACRDVLLLLHCVLPKGGPLWGFLQSAQRRERAHRGDPKLWRHFGRLPACDLWRSQFVGIIGSRSQRLFVWLGHDASRCRVEGAPIMQPRLEGLPNSGLGVFALSKQVVSPAEGCGVSIRLGRVSGKWLESVAHHNTRQQNHRVRMAPIVDIRAYYAYAFETVTES
jgi:hypothetical protein